MTRATAYASAARIETGVTLNKTGQAEPQLSQGAPIQAFTAIQGSSEQMDRINLGTVFDGRFRVHKPIPLILDRSGEGVSAVWPEIDEFGHAESASAASVELARSVVELYSTLERERMNLGPDLERVWVVLKQHIEPVRPEC